MGNINYVWLFLIVIVVVLVIPFFEGNDVISNASLLQKVYCKVAVDNIATGIAVCQNQNDTIHLIQGVGILMNITNNQINITSVGGVDNMGTNVGAGAQVYKFNTPPNLVFRSFIGTGGIITTQNANDITLSLGIKVNNATCPNGIIAFGNKTDFTCGSAVASLKSINGDTTDAQTLAGVANNVTVTDAGATHTFNLGSNVVMTQGSAQTITKSLTINSGILGGDLKVGSNALTKSGHKSTLPSTSGILCQVNQTGTCGAAGAGSITSINGNGTAAQIISGQAGNITVTDSGNTHTVGLGVNPVITGGSAQVITKGITTNALTLGGNEAAGGFKITNLNNATNPNDAVNARQLGLLGNLTYGSKCSDTQLLSYQASNQTWVCISPTSSAVINQASTYIIYTLSGTIYAKNQRTGIIDYSGTDAQTIIEDAVNATSSGGGGTIEIKDGTYNLAKALRLSNNINLHGESWNTIFHLNDNVHDNMITNISSAPNDTTTYLGNYNMTVYNLQLDGNYAKQGALYPVHNYVAIRYQNCDICIIDRVYVHDTNGMGITTTSSGVYQHQAVVNSYIKHAVGDAIFGQSYKAIFSNNLISDVGDNGIVTKGDSIVVANNQIFGDPSSLFDLSVGIGVYRSSHDISITGNTIVNAKRGMEISAFGTPDTFGCDGCTITGNVITNSSGVAIFFGSIAHDNNTRIIISNNIIQKSGSHGIEDEHSNNLLISNNIICQNNHSGIDLFIGGGGSSGGANNTLITGNTICNNSQNPINTYDGINIGGVHNNNTMIISNYIYDDQSTPTQRYGIRNDGGASNNAYASSNMVHGNSLGQISGLASSHISNNYQNYILDPSSNPSEIDSSTYRLFEQSNIMRLLRTSADSTNQFAIIPSGTSTRAEIVLAGNSSLGRDQLDLIADGTLGHEIAVSAGGTGKLDQLTIKMGTKNILRFNTDESIDFLNSKVKNPDIVDSGLIFMNALDNTKKAALDASSLTTLHTQTYTLPNNNGTLALISDITSGLISINSDITPAQLITANSANSNITVTNSGATHIIGIGKSVVVTNGTAQNFTKKIFFGQTTTLAGININATQTSNPSTTNNGDIWFINGGNPLRFKVGGTIRNVVTDSNTATISAGDTFTGANIVSTGSFDFKSTVNSLKVLSGGLTIRNPAGTQGNAIASSAIIANQTLTLPAGGSQTILGNQSKIMDLADVGGQPCTNGWVLTWQSSNSTWICAVSSSSSGITSINSDSTAAQVFSGTANNVTITDTGAGTLQWNLGTDVVMTGGSAQTFTKNLGFTGNNTHYGSSEIKVDGGVIRVRDSTTGFFYKLNAGTGLSANRTVTLPFASAGYTLVGNAAVNTFTSTNTVSTGTFSFPTTANSLKLCSGCTTFRNPAGTFGYAITTSALTANRTLTLPLITQTETLAVVPQSTFTTNSTTQTTTSTTFLMGGNTATIKPRVTVNIKIFLSGTVASSLLGDGCQIKIQYGTGTTPTGGSAVTGTTAGLAQTIDSGVGGANAAESIITGATGLTVGTAYWIQPAYAADTGGTCSVKNQMFLVQEY